MGMEIAAITMFGMLGLLIVAVRAEEAPPADTTTVSQDRREEARYQEAA